MKREELLGKLTDRQREYDWESLPDSFSYSQKLTYVCHKKDELGREHGIQYITLGKILRGDGCPKCNGKGMDKELFVHKANIIHNNEYIYDDFEFVNKKTKGRIYCCKHEIYFYQSPEKHLMGHGCPKCRYEKSAKNKTKTTDLFITQSKNIFGDTYDYHKTLYERDDKKVCIICPVHGEFWQTPSNHLQGQGCPKCGRERTTNSSRINFDEFVKHARMVHGDKYEYIRDSYTKASDDVAIICPIHGKFIQKGTNHTCLRQGCPKCSNQQSISEDEIYDFIKNEVLIEDVQKRVRNIIPPNELDIYIPSKKIAIEYNGLIWHSEKFKLNETATYHLNKTEECKKIGITLIHIFEDEWNKKKDVVKSKLRAILNKNDTIINASNCVIKKINSKKANEFLISNDLTNECHSGYKYGMYNDGNLVSLMTFRRCKKDDYRLEHFCNRKNYEITGSIEALLDHFINEVKPKKIIYKIDKRWKDGRFLEDFGFMHIKDTRPNHTYVNNSGHKRYTKSEFNKYKTYANQNKWYRIYDCGDSIYEWTNK